MTDDNGEFIRFVKRVSVVAGAIVLTAGAIGILITAGQWAASRAWTAATREIMASIEAGSRRDLLMIIRIEDGEIRDSLMVDQIANLGRFFVSPQGSPAEHKAMNKVLDTPRKMEQQETNPRRPQ